MVAPEFGEFRVVVAVEAETPGVFAVDERGELQAGDRDAAVAQIVGGDRGVREREFLAGGEFGTEGVADELIDEVGGGGGRGP
jgi:hypothetical protein